MLRLSVFVAALVCIMMQDLLADESPSHIMYWRPQKVGSSTMMSLLVTYAFRYNLTLSPKGVRQNLTCDKINACSKGIRSKLNYLVPSPSMERKGPVDEEASTYPNYHISTEHNLCNVPSKLIRQYLPCAFKDNHVHEIFSVREPLARVVSVYYFWGELFKMVQSKRKSRFGSSEHQGIVRGSFVYHGNERTPPPPAIALDFAVKLPYRKGMPGPSYTWSAFASDASDAVEVLRSGHISPIVTERLDESLVALAYSLKWSLSNVVFTMHRKSLSPHPSIKDWPQDAVAVLNNTLSVQGEFDVYRESNLALNRTLAEMASKGIDVRGQLSKLQHLRERVTKICLQDDYLERYKKYIIRKGVPHHPKGDKLRDVPAKFFIEGHGFALYTQLFFSFDLCGACEAAAIEMSVDRGHASSVEQGMTLQELLEHDESLSKEPAFRYCPLS